MVSMAVPRRCDGVLPIMKPGFILVGAVAAVRLAAQGILFDFDGAPAHAPLPVVLSAGGLTATFSATGAGFSIQSASTMGFTPPGFAGLCLYPSSVFAADLVVAFDRPVSRFSILYSPQELGCDDSATMRVTASRGGGEVGTATATATAPGTWPSETLWIEVVAGFDRVVVHYDQRPPTCQDWGPVFLADNMEVTPLPARPVLQCQVSGADLQLSWPSAAGAYVLEQSSDPAAGVGWTPAPGVPQASGDRMVQAVPMGAGPQFFRLRSP